MISLLGRIARGLRRAGLGSALRSAVALVDLPLVRLGWAPLRATIEGVPVRGFLRHRSYIAEAMRPRETYAELFVSLLRPGMTVIDGGAHVGLYTLLGSQGVGPGGIVFALEPDRYNLAALRLNAANAANAANVEIVPRALSDAEGVTTFFETRSTIGSSLIERADAKAHSVETTSIDRLLEGRGVSSLLVKLNIEGAEPLALRGMRETLARVDAVAILIEVNPPLLAAAGTDVDTMLDGLRVQGFEAFYVDLPTQQPVPLPEPLRKGHLLVSRSA
ncbi:MAG: FkbM family methyltransferase [Actinomycetota bacterium]